MKGRKEGTGQDPLSHVEFESEPLPSTLSTHATRFKATQLFAPSARLTAPTLLFLSFFSFFCFFLSLRPRLAASETELSVLARVL